MSDLDVAGYNICHTERTNASRQSTVANGSGIVSVFDFCGSHLFELSTAGKRISAIPRLGWDMLGVCQENQCSVGVVVVIGIEEVKVCGCLVWVGSSGWV
ncbi:hypothetical protein Tco_0929800 [Tanacetum coccineum]